MKSKQSPGRYSSFVLEGFFSGARSPKGPIQAPGIFVPPLEDRQKSGGLNRKLLAGLKKLGSKSIESKSSLECTHQDSGIPLHHGKRGSKMEVSRRIKH
jgi:hypothetical protein